MLESKESRKLLLFPSKYVGDTSFECGAASGSRLSSLAVGNVMIWSSLSFVVSIFKKKMFLHRSYFVLVTCSFGQTNENRIFNESLQIYTGALSV